MTESMVERVARAIYEARNGKNTWDAVFDGKRVVPDPSNWAWSAARAAIAAMREPTEAMRDAARALDGGAYDDNACGESHWEAMIDAALAEETSK